MPEPTETTAQTTSDGTAQNTGAVTETGAVTATAQQQATTQDITQTPEFKDALTAAIKNKIPQLKKQIAKEFTGENEGTPTVAELQQQLADAQKQTRTFEAKESIRDYLSDPKNQLSVKAQDMTGALDLISKHLEFDDDGSVKNLKEAVAKAQSSAPTLFAKSIAHINQGNNGKPVTANDMNAFIRQQHAGRN